jgi:hypothetical protein
MFSDAYLEHWGAVYVAARLRERGIPFREFLADPWECLKTVERRSPPLGLAGGFRPLLPRQKRVAQALWKRWLPETDGGGPATGEPDENQVLMEAGDGKP